MRQFLRSSGIIMCSLATVFSPMSLAATPASACLWYQAPARNWNEALPAGNGRLGAMVFGDPVRERLQLNEESLWAGAPVEAWPEDFQKHLDEVRRLVFAGRNAEAHAYGLNHLTAHPDAPLHLDGQIVMWRKRTLVTTTTKAARDRAVRTCASPAACAPNIRVEPLPPRVTPCASPVRTGWSSFSRRPPIT